jgi:hypothetical protein
MPHSWIFLGGIKELENSDIWTFLENGEFTIWTVLSQNAIISYHFEKNGEKVET